MIRKKAFQNQCLEAYFYESVLFNKKNMIYLDTPESSAVDERRKQLITDKVRAML